MEVGFLLEAINAYFPQETAMEEDKTGLQIQCNSNKISGILITLEVTEDVIQECIELNYNTVITFHPLIYKPLTSIEISSRVGKLCSSLIKNSINLISLHTTFDAYLYGTSKILANMLSLTDTTFLVPDKANPNCGMGVIAHSNGLSDMDLISKVHDVCNSPIKFCKRKSTDLLQKIAIVGGSGTSFINEALKQNCDAFITADATYHVFHDVKDKLLLIDVGHYEMEQFVPKGIAAALNTFLLQNAIKFSISKVLTNPVQYFPNHDYYSKQQEYLLK